MALIITPMINGQTTRDIRSTDVAAFGDIVNKCLIVVTTKPLSR